MQLILALLPLAEKLVFTIGGQLVQIATADLNSPEAVEAALAAAKAAGFPQLSFVAPPPVAAVPALPVATLAETVPAEIVAPIVSAAPGE